MFITPIILVFGFLILGKKRNTFYSDVEPEENDEFCFHGDCEGN